MIEKLKLEGKSKGNSTWWPLVLKFVHGELLESGLHNVTLWY